MACSQAGANGAAPDVPCYFVPNTRNMPRPGFNLYDCVNRVRDIVNISYIIMIFNLKFDMTSVVVKKPNFIPFIYLFFSSLLFLIFLLQSVFQLPAEMPMVTVVEVFRRMGIRNALVTVTGRLTGLLTKKDVLKYIAVQHHQDPNEVQYH
jgi:hypothetical protein